jgi:hypothetical protein
MPLDCNTYAALQRGVRADIPAMPDDGARRCLRCRRDMDGRRRQAVFCSQGCRDGHRRDLQRRQYEESAMFGLGVERVQGRVRAWRAQTRQPDGSSGETAPRGFLTPQT